MNPWLIRIGRVVAVAFFALILYYALDQYGYAWVMVPIVTVGFLAYLGETLRMRWVRQQRVRDWDRWEASVVDDATREASIGEVRDALQKSHRLGPRLRLEQAHLSVILAELLDAAGRPQEASRVLTRVKIDELAPGQGSVVRHAKAVAYLSAGDVDNADLTLRVRGSRSDEADVEARLDFLELMVAIERGDAEKALEGADVIAKKVPKDDSIAEEARVVEAAALEALGKHDEAVAKMKALSKETIAALARLGPPRVRGIAKDAQGTS
jgi:hypothetical protein